MIVRQKVPDETKGATVDQENDTSSKRSGAPGSSLTRVTANFTPRAIAALEQVAEETGDSRTDVLNRSVLVYQTFLELMKRGDGTLQITYPDGTRESLRFLG